MVHRADHPLAPGDNRGNGVRSGPVAPLFIPHRQQLGLVDSAAQILLGLPVAGDAALIALAFGLGRSLGAVRLSHFVHASTSARCRLAQRL